MKYQRIQDLRIDSDLSQKQLGEILHITQRSYSHYETGSRGIPVEMLRGIQSRRIYLRRPCR